MTETQKISGLNKEEVYSCFSEKPELAWWLFCRALGAQWLFVLPWLPRAHCQIHSSGAQIKDAHAKLCDALEGSLPWVAECVSDVKI